MLASTYRAIRQYCQYMKDFFIIMAFYLAFQLESKNLDQVFVLLFIGQWWLCALLASQRRKDITILIPLLTGPLKSTKLILAIC